MSSQKSILSSTIAREPQRERGKLRVAALLDAGAALFAEKGYEGATMTEIAARANAAIGSLYQFFPSKEALADALLARYEERVGRAWDELAQRAAGLSDGALADAFIEVMSNSLADRATTVALIDARGDPAGRRLALRSAMRRRIAAILLAVHPRLPSARAEAMAVMVLHILKAVPALAEEGQALGHDLVAEAREAIRLYVAHGAGGNGR